MVDETLLNINGVPNALNNIAVCQETNEIFLHDCKGHITRVNLSSGVRKDLTWYDKDYLHHRWTCTALFVITLETLPFLVILFFNKTKKYYKLSCFSIANGSETALHCITEHRLILKDADNTKTKYSASLNGYILQVIFYQKAGKWFNVFELDCRDFKLFEHKGIFPSKKSCWELPFVLDNNIHFISHLNSKGYLLSYRKGTDNCYDQFGSEEILPDKGSNPIFNATWAVESNNTSNIFMVVKTENDRKTVTLWEIKLGTNSNKPIWSKIDCQLNIDKNGCNFGIRLLNNKCFYLHYDINELNSKIHKVNLKEIELQWMHYVKDDGCCSSGADTNHLLGKDEDSDNVVCHICLEMYNKPQVLVCGHSLCKDCIDRMLSATTRTPKVVSCPICRIETTVPETGLAPNYELEKALESFLRKKNMLDKNRVCHGCNAPFIDTDLWTCFSCVQSCSTSLSNSTLNMYCGQCLLTKGHANHNYLSLPQFQNQQDFIIKEKVKIEAERNNVFKAIKSTLFESFYKVVLEKEMSTINEELDKLLQHDLICKNKDLVQENVNSILENFQSDSLFLVNEAVHEFEIILAEKIEKRKRILKLQLLEKLSKEDSI